jgi:hypothetical protein
MIIDADVLISYQKGDDNPYTTSSLPAVIRDKKHLRVIHPLDT